MAWPLGKRRYRYGQIVRAEVKDRNGYRKKRPVVILTGSNEIAWDEPIAVMAITTKKLGPPLPPNYVRLPSAGEPGSEITGLPEFSAAVSDWLDIIYPDQIKRVYGNVPSDIMSEIQRRVDKQGEDDEEEEGDADQWSPA